MSTVSAVVDDMDGKIQLETSSSGTKFSLYFPKISNPSNDANVNGDELIFVVDNDEAILDNICMALEEKGYITSSFTSAASVIKALQIESPSAIVLDFNMPNMDGLATYKAIVHVRSTPTIIYSSFVTKSQVMELEIYGISGIVEKQDSHHELLKNIREIIDKKSSNNQRLEKYKRNFLI